MQSKLIVNLYSTVFQSESPSESDLNALGHYLLTSLFFVVGAMIEFAIVIMVNRIRTIKGSISDSEMEANIKKFFGEKPRYQSEGYDGQTPIENFNTEACKHIEIEKKSNTNRILSLQSVNGIDIVAFLMFFSCYLLFNIQYWIQYGYWLWVLKLLLIYPIASSFI